jgi:phage anti-repressor protein
MDQLITNKPINFNDVVKNSNTTISLDIQSKLVELMNIEFTEEEQRWYVANLYVYMNYHVTNDYPINLEDVYKMIGFVHKKNAKRTLENNFIEGEDYKVALLHTEKRKNEGGFNKETVMLNVDTFKNLCMMVKTDKGKQIRKYYVKLENIYNKIIKQEIEQQKLLLEKEKETAAKLLEEKDHQLQIKDKLLEDLENKPQTFGFGKKSGYNYIIKDNSTIGHYKIGFADRVDSRLSALNTSSSTKSLELVSKFFSSDKDGSEKLIHNILHPFGIKNYNQQSNEWFYFKNDLELSYAIKTIRLCVDFINENDFKDYSDFKMKNKELDLKNELDTALEKQEHYKTQDNIELINDFTVKNNELPFYKGVVWVQEKLKWKSEFQYNCKRVFLGYFANQIDAAKIYNDYAAYLNKTENANLILNNIRGYKTIPRNVPELNKLNNQSQNTSKYKGVSYDSKRRYYVTSIKLSGKTYNLGLSEDETECAKLYNQQALYFNNTFNTNYILNDIPDYTTIPKDLRKDIVSKKKTSNYHGVSLTRNKKWACSYMMNKKKIHIGTFTTELEACKVYNDTVKELNQQGFNYKTNLIRDD